MPWQFFQSLLIHGASAWRSFTLIWKTLKGNSFPYSSENTLKNVPYFEFISGKWFIEFQLTLRNSVLNVIRLVSRITFLWIVIFWFSLWNFDREFREMVRHIAVNDSFFEFNEVSKKKKKMWIYYQLKTIFSILYNSLNILEFHPPFLSSFLPWFIKPKFGMWNSKVLICGPCISNTCYVKRSWTV